MSRTIWKFPIKTADMIGIDLPSDAEILDIQVQNDIPCIWFLVDPDFKTREQRTFFIYGTGHIIDFPESKKYIGTYQLLNGDLVFHVFELIQ